VWNQQVLSYTQTQQLRLLENLGFEAPDWQSLVQVLGVVLSGAALLGVVIARSQQPRPDLWVALLRRARAHLREQGVPIPLQATPRQMRECIAQAWPDRHSDWHEWLLAMEKCRYSPAEGSGVATLARQYARLP
jgi:protein-glutamine gamma-glutamyltransferase